MSESMNEKEREGARHLQMEKNRSFVFVHGAHCGAWVWKEVVNQLKSQGLEAHAVDLPGHGLKRHISPASHKNYVDSVNSFILERDLKNIVLVGHSMGGSVIPYCAMDLKERVSRLIFFSTIFPEAGETVLSVAPFLLRYFIKAFLFLTRYKPFIFPRFYLKMTFCNDMSNGQSDQMMAQLGPQPARPIITSFSAVDTNPFRSLYIVAERDRVIPPKKQIEIFCRIPNCQVESMDTGHFGMIS